MGKTINHGRQVTVRLPVTLAEKIQRAAQAHGLSFSDALRAALRSVFANDEVAQAALAKPEVKP